MEFPSSKRIKFIDSLWTFFVALVFLGPFALPLLWRNPRWGQREKVLGSVFIIILTLGLAWFSAGFLSQFKERLEQLKSMQESSP